MSLKEVVAKSEEILGYSLLCLRFSSLILGVLQDILGKLHKDGSWKVPSMNGDKVV